MIENSMIGLVNNNNICFLNVIIQSLYNLSSVKHYILSLTNHSHNLSNNINRLQQLDSIQQYFKQQLEIENSEAFKEVCMKFQQKIESGLYFEQIGPYNNCIVCYLSQIFNSYMFSEKKSIDVTNLRKLFLALNDCVQKFNLKDVLC
jgi:hypothetical protein